MAKKVKVLVLRTAGTNCNEETVFAFKHLGGSADEVHINRLLKREKNLKDYHILALPGGFSYGDDIAAGRILANELRIKLGGDIRSFIKDKKIIIGICNGFQILVKAGFLPGDKGPFKKERLKQTVTLMNNDSGKFEDRWTYLKPQGRCIWTEGMTDVIYAPVAHGEGKFVPGSANVLRKIKENKQIVFTYCNKDGEKGVYPENPNGSIGQVAGITDSTGRILGMMPHPERHFLFTQHPCWTRLDKKKKLGDGAKIFQNGIQYIKENLL